MEKYVTGTGQTIYVHKQRDCSGPPCVIHHPSPHALTQCPTHWRYDRGIMERICKHRIGHPDPDGLASIERELGKERADAEGIHGCDGCCQEEK